MHAHQHAYPNFAASFCGLALDTGATTYDMTAALDFAIQGKAYTKATVSNGTTPTTDANTAAAITLGPNQGVAVLWGVNASGTVSVYAGRKQTVTDAGVFDIAPEFAPVPDNIAVFGYSVHKADSTVTTWTFGSSNWDASGVTSTAQSLLCIPPKPVTA